MKGLAVLTYSTCSAEKHKVLLYSASLQQTLTGLISRGTTMEKPGETEV